LPLFTTVDTVSFGVRLYPSCCSNKEYWIMVKVRCSKWEGWLCRRSMWRV